MKEKALLVLGLLAGCDRLFQSQLGTDPTLCTQSSSLCPSGQLCDFTSGTCQPIGGMNPPGWSLAMDTVAACPQPPTLKITGPLTGTPQVRLNTLDVDPADVALGTDGTLTVTLPRQLPAGAVQVTLTFSASQPPVVLSGFQYETKTASVTMLVPVQGSLANLPADVSQLATWQPRRGGALDLALLGGGGSPLVHYRDAVVASRQTPTFAHLLSLSTLTDGTLLQSGNLATVTDPQSGDGVLITATATAGSAAYFLGGSDAPIVKVSDTGSSSYTVVRQLVAGGFFKDDGGSIQALTFLGWQSGGNGLLVKHNPGPGSNNQGSDYTTIATAIPNPLPLALAAGSINSDAYTDVILLVGATFGPASAGFAISGGPTPNVTAIPALPIAVTTLTLGNLDSDPRPEAVFGINPGAGQSGKIAVYLNQSTKTAISWDPTNTIFVAARNAPTALAVADYNGDGRNDIIYGAADGVHVLLNQATGTGKPAFTDTLVYAASGWTVNSLVTADFSGDSRPDVIVADGKSRQVVLLENSCSPAP